MKSVKKNSIISFMRSYNFVLVCIATVIAVAFVYRDDGDDDVDDDVVFPFKQ